jgi:ArsR family transcriptional regulator, arsenate/arsenite/antimonite-responsive transcriptional repressor
MTATTPDLRQATRLFQALSDEKRLRIVQMLSGGEQCVCDLQAAVGAYQSRLSFHLRKLKDAGLVSDRRDGRWVHYALRPEALEEMRAFLGDVRPEAPAAPSWSSPGEGCCR